MERLPHKQSSVALAQENLEKNLNQEWSHDKENMIIHKGVGKFGEKQGKVHFITERHQFNTQDRFRMAPTVLRLVYHRQVQEAGTFRYGNRVQQPKTDLILSVIVLNLFHDAQIKQ